jgi:hypothetical protein
MALSHALSVQSEECTFTDIELIASPSSSILAKTSPSSSNHLARQKATWLSRHDVCHPIVILVCVIGLALLAIISTWEIRSGVRERAYSIDCGSTPSEAKANNCRFDIMEIAWVPQKCFDETRMLAEDPFGRWEFFQDVHREWHITEEVLRSGELPVFYADWTFHQAHCAYILKRLVRGVVNGAKMPNRTVDMQHTMHCSGALVEQKRRTMVTMAIVNYLACIE